MHLLAFLPGLAIGVFYALQYGNWIFLLAMLLSAAASTLSRRSVAGPIAIERDGLDFRVNGRLLSQWPILWNANHRDAVYREVIRPTGDEVERAIARAQAEQRATGSLLLGVSDGLQPVTITPNQSAPHLLIVGASGSGKSVLLANLARSVDQLIDIDFKGGGNLAELPAVLRLNNLDDEQQVFWQRLNQLLDDREADFHIHHADLHVFVDELGAVLTSSTVAAKTLERIATRGRSASVYLIAANQSTAAVPRTLILNAHHRVLLGNTDPIDRTQLGAKAQAQQMPSSPRLLRGEYLSGGLGTNFTFIKPVEGSRSIAPVRGVRQNPLGG